MRQLTILTAALALLAGTAVAQTDYPTRPITMIVPFAAGGPTDTVARLIAEPMTAPLGQQVIVENVAGAGGTLGAGREAKADPDGYTLLVHHIGLATQRRALPQAALRSGDGVRADRADHRRADDGRRQGRFASRSVGELLDYIRAHGEEVIFAHGGVGAVSHLCGMLLMEALGTKMTAVRLQGQRAGDDRPAGRPGRHDLRPDHQHGGPHQEWQDQGLCRHHPGTAAAPCPICRRSTKPASRASR